MNDDRQQQVFFQLLLEENPLQIVGVVNAFHALLAEHAGFRSLYLSGAGVANACYGLPDLSLTSLSEVCEEVRRISAVSQLPLLVDADTGWGGSLNIDRTVKQLTQSGAKALHIEDQQFPKRCGHRKGKILVSREVMVERIKAAVDARQNSSVSIMARTDAYTVEGLNAAIERAGYYAEAGADLIFAEAVSQLTEFQQFCHSVQRPVLANMTEFGVSPLFSLSQLEQVGVSLVLYPLSAFRAMNKAALDVFQSIRQQGSQKSMVNRMQTRSELYQHLNYQPQESQIDLHERTNDD